MATRVYNLDSRSLDQYFNTEISNQINELIKQFGCNKLERFNDELKLLVNLFIWHKTINSNQSSVGHSVFGLKFNDLPTHKRYIFFFFSVIFPFFENKFGSINSTYFIRMQKTLRLFNLINFLIFLRTGNYLNFWHRLFKIDPQFTNQSNLNQATYEFMNRELVWSTAIDFLTFIIPTIDLNKSWTKLKFSFINEQSFKINQLSEKIKRDDHYLTLCNICFDSPIDPHETGCYHVYCYYCVMSQFELANKFTCFSCKLLVNDKKYIKRINFRCLIDN